MDGSWKSQLIPIGAATKPQELPLPVDVFSLEEIGCTHAAALNETLF